jgi:hypothetical protein
MANTASPPPTDADLAKARLLIARSDQAKKTRRSKGSCKGTNQDQENNDPNDTKRKKPALTVAYVALLNDL